MWLPLKGLPHLETPFCPQREKVQLSQKVNFKLAKDKIPSFELPWLIYWTSLKTKVSWNESKFSVKRRFYSQKFITTLRILSLNLIVLSESQNINFALKKCKKLDFNLMMTILNLCASCALLQVNFYWKTSKRNWNLFYYIALVEMGFIILCIKMQHIYQ